MLYIDYFSVHLEKNFMLYLHYEFRTINASLENNIQNYYLN